MSWDLVCNRRLGKIVWRDALEVWDFNMHRATVGSHSDVN